MVLGSVQVETTVPMSGPARLFRAEGKLALALDAARRKVVNFAIEGIF